MDEFTIQGIANGYDLTDLAHMKGIDGSVAGVIPLRLIINCIGQYLTENIIVPITMISRTISVPSCVCVADSLSYF